MSSDIVISVKDVAKCYQIYDHPRDRLRQFIMPRLYKLLGKVAPKYFREFWALRNVSFEVGKGETVGIVGRNGSGKSTLLQIICGTTTPTSGQVTTNGRIAALLELGAGFNPEFTGRENVYMNAAILGLTQAEIDARLDDILAFADIGDFVDQPVKVYSSGMYVRLAFSVAVNVAPQILIVDEALSVGDLAFQNKCILKIKELRDQGTTLLFVAHDLSILQMICDRVAWLQRGEIVTIGDSVNVCQEYYVATTGTKLEKINPATIIPQKETGMAKFVDIAHERKNGPAKPVYTVGEAIHLTFKLSANVKLDRSVFTVSIFRADGDWTIGQTSLEEGVFWEPCEAGGTLQGKLVLEPNCLAPGDYLVAIGANSEDLSICYALSELSMPFSVRCDYPTWGRFIHPCQWIPYNTQPRIGIERNSDRISTGR